jgi:hypothetical protein
MSERMVRRGVVFMVAMGFAGMCAVALAEPAGKWRIAFDHWAEQDGALVLRIAPLEGDPIEVSAAIRRNTSKVSAAKLVSVALEAQLGEGYKVEFDDGPEVLVKRRGDTPKFEISVVNSTTGLVVSAEEG